MKLKIVKTDKPFPVMSREADTDYLLARFLAFCGADFHARAGYFSQMACEKYLKALTIQNNNSYADNTHKLLALVKLCENFDPYFKDAETRRLLEQFDMFDQVGRYGAAAKFDPLSSGKPVGGMAISVGPGLQLAGVAVWTTQHLHDLDGFVFKTRSLFDYAKIGWGDRFQQLLSGPVSPEQQWWKDILTRNNRYFKA